MDIRIISLFPKMIEDVLQYGVLGRAKKNHLLSFKYINPRDFSKDTHRTIDDRPYGGGPGMVMKYEPLSLAIKSAKEGLSDTCPVICLGPQGKLFDQEAAKRFSRLPGFILISGRYEGIDERIIESFVDEELSIGDFVLSGGEIPVLAVIDAVVRLIPGVLGDESSAKHDSFMSGIFDTPHYTRPKEIDGQSVPEVLLSGDHERIIKWRAEQAIGRTYLRRPDLIKKLNLNEDQKTMIEEYLKNHLLYDQ